MSREGLTEELILGAVAWPKAAWQDHFDFVPDDQAANAKAMGEAEGTLVAFLDVQQIERLCAKISVDPKARGKGFSVRIKLDGQVLRRCALSGEMLTESVAVVDQFDFIQAERAMSAQKKLEAQMAEDLGTGLEDGPDIWDEQNPPTYIGLIADALEDALDPFPMADGAEVASEHASDPLEAELAEKMHPFAALKALKKDGL